MRELSNTLNKIDMSLYVLTMLKPVNQQWPLSLSGRLHGLTEVNDV